MKERAQKQDARLAAKQAVESQKEEKEKEAQESERKMREQNHQLALAERFLLLVDRGLDPEAVGRVVFRADVWDEIKDSMMSLVKRE